MRITLTLVRALAALTLLAIAPPAFASEAGDQAAVAEKAARLYSEGRRLLQEGRAEEALLELDASLELMPSPNTELLRAHALRALGRRMQAMAAYERVVRDAGANVRAGEDRFAPTLEEAGRWVALLKTELGELVIQVRAANAKTILLVNGEPVATAYDERARIARARLWREPGRFRIEARGDSGIQRSSEARVGPGDSQSISLDVTPPPPVTRAPEPSHGPPVASWVAFGVGAAGFATLAVAGTLASQKMSELDDCRPRCAREDADDAETKATIANVGLVVGIAGMLTGAGVWLTHELGQPSPQSARGLVLRF